MTKSLFTTVVAIAFGTTLVGCDLNLPGVARTRDIDSLKSQVDDLSKDISDRNSTIDQLKAELESLTQNVQNDELSEMLRNFEEVAFLKPGDEGYSSVKFDLGYLTVQLSDIKPYANGTKVVLRFGNSLSASVNGLKAQMDWGKVNDKGQPISAEQKTKDVNFTETIKAGAWTSTSVVLEGVPPSELGFVRLRNLMHTGIVLSTR